MYHTVILPPISIGIYIPLPYHVLSGSRALLLFGDSIELLQHLRAKASSFHPSTPRSFYGLTKNKVKLAKAAALNE